MINCEYGHVSDSQLGTESRELRAEIWQMATHNWQLSKIICSFSTNKKLSKNFKCFDNDYDNGDLEAARMSDGGKATYANYRASDRNYIHKI